MTDNEKLDIELRAFLRKHDAIFNRWYRDFDKHRQHTAEGRGEK